MSIKENLDRVRSNINDYAIKSGRNYDDITLIAVTKTIDMDRINEALSLGVTDIGENRPQEIRDKLKKLDKNINVHMIGQLQSNKVKYIIEGCKLIHSIDRLSLLDEINKRAANLQKNMHTLIQINHTDDENRGGIKLSKLREFVENLPAYDHITVDGLMCVASLSEDEKEIREEFAATRRALEDLKNLKIKNLEPTILSMGMSHDYHLAILEGATHVRIGSAIFGARKRR